MQNWEDIESRMQVQEDVMMAREKLMGSILAMKKGKGSEREGIYVKASFRFMCFLIFFPEGTTTHFKSFFYLIIN